ncbi:MAG: polysaccharide deacetylase family protein [Lachnospiraceae bacterium]|nr:polysaccharide deacetylase family protein [Lachnospiraceae bacterium]
MSQRRLKNKLKNRAFIALMLVFALSTAYINESDFHTYDVKSIIASVGTKELPIYCVSTNKPQVAISFDAAWGNEDTGKILKILKENNVSATFFMTGGWVSEYPDDVLAIYKAGHDLGNHSENHKNMSQLSSEEIKKELTSVTDKVKEITGTQMELFRPPYGDYDNHVITNARDCGYYSIQWSVDSLDWKNYGAQEITDTILNHKALKNGAIILMHNGAKYTATALPDVINGLKEKGYEIVPISKLIYKSDYHIEHDGSQVKNN